jgi:group II intron reverse transcriptase/maturase
MVRIARKVKDRRILALIRKYLESGVLLNGVKVATEEGTPQGGPISPLLSNILLDDLDKELERRGHCFVRYADDCNIYVRSVRAAERVMDSVRAFLERALSLRVNREKSAVDRPWKRKFLGFSLLADKEHRIRLASQSLVRVKERIRAMTRSRRTEDMQDRIRALNDYLGGWLGYFALAETPSVFRKLDSWLRRRLRACQWRLWKRIRTRVRELQRLGLPREEAFQQANTRKGSWRTSLSPMVMRALSNAFWRGLGLLNLEELHYRIRDGWRTAGCVTARPVV